MKKQFTMSMFASAEDLYKAKAEHMEAKLNHVLSELNRVALPGSTADPDPSPYWDAVQVRCDNATDEIVDTDLFHKNLIKYINEEE